jgi:hypothetical protein
MGLLEALISDEEDNATDGKRIKRLELVEDALDKLQQAYEMRNTHNPARAGQCAHGRAKTMKKPSEQIEQSQYKLHEAILRALAEFSDATGLSVSAAHWQVTRAMDADGHTQGIHYHDVCTNLASGACWVSR